MDYFTLALLTGSLIGASSGLAGVLVLARRRVFFAQALTHATYPGAVGAALLGWPVPVGAALVGLGAVYAMTGLNRVSRQGRHVAAGIILTGGFSGGALLQALSPALSVNPEELLVGSILTVRVDDLVVAAAVLLAICIVYAGWGPRLLFSSVDTEGYRAAGFREGSTDALSLAIITGAVVAALPAVGAILAIALIAAPAQAARLLSRSVVGNLILAPVLGVLSVLIGLYASRNIGIAAGSAMAMTAAAIFVLALVVSLFRRRTIARVLPVIARGGAH